VGVDHFTPHLEALRDVFQFTVESQILYHAPLTFEPVFGPPPMDHVGAELDEAIGIAGEGNEEVEQVVKAELSKEGKIKEGAWLIGDEEMKGFINTERWSLGQFIDACYGRSS
jgi:phosphatidylinositol glycan class S